MKKKRLLPLGILAVLVLSALIYTRPMTLEAMFGLDITQRELVYTDYLTVSIDEPGRSVESSEWLRGEERTETLISLLSQQKFRRSLANLLPQGGTTHRTQDGDFPGRSASASTRPISLTAAPARACLSPAGTFLASCRFSALTTARPSAAPCRIRTRFCSRSMTSFPLNRNPFHTLSQQEESL